MSPAALMQTLGFAGLIPFIATALGTMFLDDLLLALSQRSFLLYSTAILCFLAGTLWGETLPEPKPGQGAAILVSNGVVLFAVFAMLTAQPMLAAVFLMLGHLAQLWYERQKPDRSPWYTRLRSRLTLVAVFTHLMFIVGLTMRASL